MSVTQMSAAKRNADTVVRSFRAIALLSCNLTRTLREALDEHLVAIPTMTARDLKGLTEHTERSLFELREKLGALAPTSDYLTLVADMERHPEQALWMQKHEIDAHLFSKMESVVPRWPLFPPHLRVAIDHHGLAPDGLEWRLLEASLFESAALLWNDVTDSVVDDSAARGDDKIPGKRHRELKRSTIRAVFALLEGYLNGIAYDVSLTTDVAALSKGAQELLSERDASGRARFKTLREKLFAYPRLALGLEHSPLADDDAHVRYLLDHERRLRDAFVHPTPRQEPGQAVLREHTFFEFELSVVNELFEHAIAVIRNIDTVLNGKFGRVSIWLKDRDATGKFPRETFH